MNPKLKSVFINYGGCDVLRLLNKHPRVLFFHSVGHCPDEMVGMFTTPIHEFEKEINWLTKHFEIISIEELENRYRSGYFSNREMVLTFDDGYENALTEVQPILSSISIPFTVFVSTDHIDSGEFFPTSINRIIFCHSGLNKITIPSIGKEFFFNNENERLNCILQVAKVLKTSRPEIVKHIVQDLVKNISEEQWAELQSDFSSEKPLTWAQIGVLSEGGAIIGSHCKEHISLVDNIPEDIIRDEMIGSKSVIEQHINKPCKYFSYPSGHHSSCAVKYAAELFDLSFTTAKKQSLSRKSLSSLIPRIEVGRSLDDLKLLVSRYPSF